MLILSIDTSADETSVAITSERRVISHVEYTQIKTHSQWGGIVPSIAKRAHAERIDYVVEKVLKQAGKQVNRPLTAADMDYIAVTYGPGLAIALEVGIIKAQELARKYGKKIIPVNHMEGHIYSSFAQNSNGAPERAFHFPFLALLVSGGHTELVLLTDHIHYQILGQTVDDAAGEALDKAAKMLGFGYPGGPIIERLAEESANKDYHRFPRPMLRSKDLNFSFSGLKTAFLYGTNKMNDQEKASKSRMYFSSFQEAVFDTLVKKTDKALEQTDIKTLTVGGGVAINKRLRELLRNLLKKKRGTVYFPPYKYLTGDNAAMIGIAAYYKLQKGITIEADQTLDRVPRLSLEKDLIIR